MPTTEELIVSLSTTIEPVRRPRPPMVRCACWLTFATVIVAMLGISHGIRPDLLQRFQDPLFTVRVLAALATGILAAVAAFQISLPDRADRWAWLPLPAAAVWLSTIGYGCLTSWTDLDPDGVYLVEVLSCLATLILTSTPLSLAMFLMIRRVGPFRPISSTLYGALAIAAITATALSLLHSLDATVLILVWNLGVAVLFMGLGGPLGAKLRMRGLSSP